MTIHDFFILKQVGIAWVAITLGLSPLAWSQELNTGENVEETLPATGTINDLEGLEERRVNDWFPQDSISDGQTEAIFKINDETDQPSVNDSQIIRSQDNDWKNNTSGEPKQSGAGIPLGNF
ncbi:MAG: hypothetical protein RLZZ568_1533 [Cyanobacteriota bacterium]|jgi:hypothetical protein